MFRENFQTLTLIRSIQIDDGWMEVDGSFVSHSFRFFFIHQFANNTITIIKPIHTLFEISNNKTSLFLLAQDQKRQDTDFANAPLCSVVLLGDYNMSTAVDERDI